MRIPLEGVSPMISATSQAPPRSPADAQRPDAALPAWQIVQLSIYWFGLTSIFTGLETVVLPERFGELLPPAAVGLALGVASGLGALVAVVVQPTAGSLSDYTITRWGRRKPYILIGSSLDLVFLIGLARSDAVVAMAAFYLLLQLSSNIAQGPFQGYVPDLVPPSQVGFASAMVGVMSVLGPVVGTILVSLPLALAPHGSRPDFSWATIALGAVELTTAIVTVVSVDEGRRAKDRAGRSWAAIARQTWGRDVLRERSFVFLVGSRLLILAGVSMFTREVDLYLRYSLGLDAAARGFWLAVAPVILGVAIVLSCLPAARLSDRFGRKPLIFVACGVGAAGCAVILVAPGIALALLGSVLVGIAAGTFVAVDWALMTDIIPKEDSGRYMGLSNVATGLAGTLAVVTAGVVIFLANTLLGSTSLGPRLAFAVGSAFFLAGAVLLRPVDPTRRDLRLQAA